VSNSFAGVECWERIDCDGDDQDEGRAPPCSRVRPARLARN